MKTRGESKISFDIERVLLTQHVFVVGWLVGFSFVLVLVSSSSFLICSEIVIYLQHCLVVTWQSPPLFHERQRERK